VLTVNCSPYVGSLVVIMRSNSWRMRSADTICSRSFIDTTAETSAASGSKPSVATNRAARSMRNGSSLKLSCGDNGVRSRLEFRSSSPPCGSTMRGAAEVSSSAIALMVKSRRDKSVSTESENCTSGLRESGS